VKRGLRTIVETGANGAALVYWDVVGGGARWRASWLDP
jgi:hypothetical protein